MEITENYKKVYLSELKTGKSFPVFVYITIAAPPYATKKQQIRTKNKKNLLKRLDFDKLFLAFPPA